MGRSVFNTPTNYDEERIYQIIVPILNQDGYKQIEREGEIVWKKGTGALTAMHYIKFDYTPGNMIISGWVQVGLGSAGFSDMELTGFTASIPKKSTFKTIQKIRKAIM